MIRGGRAGRLLENRLRRISDAGGIIVDLGTPQRFHKELRPFERLFEAKNYRAYGYEPRAVHAAYDCDGHQDIEALTFGDGEVDAVICLDVLEHVADPFKAAREISRVIRPAGFLLLTVPFQSGYHGKGGGSQGHEAYPDYWRMTHSGLQLLFRQFSDVEVTPTDGPIEFRLRQFYLGPVIDHSFVRPLIDAIDRPSNGRATSRHLLFGRK
jgi:SAM-dependent methyltransferase